MPQVELEKMKHAERLTNYITLELAIPAAEQTDLDVNVVARSESAEKRGARQFAEILAEVIQSCSTSVNEPQGAVAASPEPRAETAAAPSIEETASDDSFADLSLHALFFLAGFSA